MVDVGHALQSVWVLVWVCAHFSFAKAFTAHACVPNTSTGDVIVSDVFEEVRFFAFLQTGDVPGHMPHEVASLVACVPLGNI